MRRLPSLSSPTTLTAEPSSGGKSRGPCSLISVASDASVGAGESCVLGLLAFAAVGACAGSGERSPPAVHASAAHAPAVLAESQKYRARRAIAFSVAPRRSPA